MIDLEQTISDSFCQYAGAVIQSRALVDVRDGLKPSARQIFYSMLQNKLTHKNPFKKTTNAIGRAMADYYIHGDSSAEGIIMHSGQNFTMRYPLIDVNGNAGTLISSGSWAAPRYTESRLSQLSANLFENIEKDTITEWRDNYDNTKQFPAVLPSRGFYNICNGTQGIAVGMASSIPQYNLKELNNALVYLLNHPDCSFEEIYCPPDFATGAILYNEKEVKESMKNGTGFACKLRSVVTFDNKDRCFIVTEIPFGVYTNTICNQLEEIVNSDENPGIDRFNDLTGSTALIKIYLTKKANPDKVLKYLYKNTSLQSYFGINFTMLDKGKFPKVFTWKEMLQAHIDHEKEVYRRGFQYDLYKIEKRLHIIDGLLICLANIDEVVALIKASNSTATALTALQTKFLLDEEQAKAVLDMKLSRLAHLEVKKLTDEREQLLQEASHIKDILSIESLFNNELINGWTETARLFGDARRTQILNLDETTNNEVIEEKQLNILYTNHGRLNITESSSLYTQKRNGVGSKITLEKDEYIINSLIAKNTDTLLLFTEDGNFYHLALNNLTIDEKQYFSNYLPAMNGNIIAASVYNNCTNQYLLFITRQGLIKKTSINEYNLKNNKGAQAIKLDANDSIVNVICAHAKATIGIATKDGNFIMIDTTDIKAIGRLTRGIIGIKLNIDDYVTSSKLITDDTKFITSITQHGLCKSTPFNEFTIQNRGIKGNKLQKINEHDTLADFVPVINTQDLIITASHSQIRITLTDIPVLSKGTIGVQAIKLAENSHVIKIEAY